MSLTYLHLDAQTRDLMLHEIDFDKRQDTLFISPRLTVEGRAQYEPLLREAIRHYDDAWLAEQLRAHNYIQTREFRREPNGSFRRATVPQNAAQVLAEGEFNRFYIRAICVRALAQGLSHVEIYRAKAVTTPRPRSEALRGERIPAQHLLDSLRFPDDVEPLLGAFPAPNTGLSVRLPEAGKMG